IEAEFSGGDITSDGGVLLLHQVDQKLGLLEAINPIFHDPCDQGQVKLSQLSLIKHRVYGLCLGYEDLNDHQQLRLDSALQTAVNRDDTLASQSTLCRLENRSNRQAMVDIHQILVNQFIASFKEAPEELILDFDATDAPTHMPSMGPTASNSGPNQLHVPACLSKIITSLWAQLMGLYVCTESERQTKTTIIFSGRSVFSFSKIRVTRQILIQDKLTHEVSRVPG
ncbi:MAG: hypothetical protein GY744_00015, partial [Gammaproteobacteria bacterium]|nr:hypothetical protein [Gammaproteobacteria bacterium]